MNSNSRGSMEVTQVTGDQMTYSAVFLAAGVGILLILMVFHQQWEYIEDEKYTANQRRWRGIWLGVISNLIGGSVMVAFIVLRLKRLL